jgi:hypothetical protein
VGQFGGRGSLRPRGTTRFRQILSNAKTTFYRRPKDELKPLRRLGTPRLFSLQFLGESDGVGGVAAGHIFDWKTKERKYGRTLDFDRQEVLVSNGILCLDVRWAIGERSGSESGG